MTTLASVPELVEHVLLQLPLRDILIAQRVNKVWKAIITNSPSIQKALFFRPVEDIQLSLVETRDIKAAPCASRAECDYEYDNVHSVPSPGGITRWGVDIADERGYCIVLNPILGVETPWSQRYFVENKVLGVENKFRSDKAYRRPEASWRKMLFAQRPLKEAIVYHSIGFHWHLAKAQDGSKGLTVGDVHNSARAFGGTLRTIWGEDGFAPGVPDYRPGAFVLAKLRQAPGKVDEDTDDEGSYGETSDDGSSDDDEQ